MEIHYRGTITKKDFLRCILLLNPSLKWQRWFMGAILSLIIFSLVYLWVDGTTDTINSILSLGPTGLIPIVFFLYPWWLPYLQLTAFDQKTNIYRNEVFGEVNEREINISNLEVKASLQWSVYTRYSIEKDFLLLRQGKYGFNAFKPSMFSTNDDWEKFIALVKNKVSQK